MKTLSESDRAILLEQEADARESEAEMRRDCWLNCPVHATYHSLLDRQLDRLEEQLVRDGDWALWEGAEDAALNVDLESPPFA